MKYLYSTDGDDGLSLCGKFNDIADAKTEACQIMRKDNEAKEEAAYKFFVSDKPLKMLLVGWQCVPEITIENITKEE